MLGIGEQPTEGVGEAGAEAPAPAVPVVFADRYEVRVLLGQGGMGSVFRVYDRELAEEVALKVLLQSAASDPSVLERFRREVKLARRVTHPNVARTYDLGHHGEVRFLTMELVIGESLASVMRAQQRLALPEILRVAEQIARGLCAAHAVGVVHRDLKPDNVMRCAGSNGRLVITDFGIARLAEGASAEDMGATLNRVVGTPAYMAPEQVANEAIDGRTDVYALGTLLFEMLTGSIPFHRDSVVATLAARLAEEPPDPRELDRDIPEPLALLTKHALARRRVDRPDADTMLNALERIRGAGDRHDRGPLTGRAVPGPRSTPTAAALTRTQANERAVAVAPVDVPRGGPWSGEDLGAALADGLSALRGLDVLPPGVVGEAVKGRDARAAARDLGAAWLLATSLRAEGARARARVRLVDVEKGTQLWAAGPLDAIEGESFAFEDQLVSIVTGALRERLGDGKRASVDPEIQAALDRAATAVGPRTVPAIRAAIAILEEARAKQPHNAALLGMLGANLVRLYATTGSSDAALAARAEETSLRALAADPTLGQAYQAIGFLRAEQGEMRAGVRAYQEALARAPMSAEPHTALGALLAETGHVDEALRYFDAALRLDSSSSWGRLERARMQALLGDRDGALAELRAIGPAGQSVLVRTVVWWNDRAGARELAEAFENEPTGAAWEVATPLLRAFAAGELLPMAPEMFRAIASRSEATARNRCRLAEAAVDYFGAIGDLEHAFEWLEQIELLPSVNVLWLDRCPCLDALRDDARFERVRGVVAARGADLWR